jgi:hypothetical protein
VMPLDYVHFTRLPSRQFQELKQVPQMRNIDNRRVPIPDRRACDAIQHPGRNLVDPVFAIAVGLHASYEVAATLKNLHQGQSPAEPRMPAIAHLDLGTVGVLSRLCTTRSGRTARWVTVPRPRRCARSRGLLPLRSSRPLERIL